ncbi:MAG: phenylacetate--CoA ligase [Bacteroidetes bacterium]|nr:phenylacetate--CoA ligase [Bacteroidota bacterium]
MNRELSIKSVSEIREYQSKLLSAQLDWVMENSPFYREHLAGFKVGSVTSVDELISLPVTTKDHLQQRNMDFLCVEREKIIDYITTSGTTGSPITFAATENDLQRLADNEYASFICAGGTSSDIYQLMLTLDRRFMAGLAYFLGLRKLGAGIIRVGPGNVILQFDTIQRTSPTVLVTVPSFLLKLIEHAEEQHIDLSATSVGSAICIGEPIRDSNFRLNKLGRRILSKWDIKLYSTYASTEMGAAFTECSAGAGGHLNPEMIVVEFLDEKNRPVKEGELGEVTITSLAVEGMPLVRFKTGDITHHFTETCSCGRNTLRLGPIVGRKKQMIKYKGTTLFPPAFYEILNEIREVENYIVVVSTNSIDTDDIQVLVGSREPTPSVEKTIKDHFRAKLRVAPSIRFMDPKEVARMQHPDMSRKPLTFLDRRKA